MDSKPTTAVAIITNEVILPAQVVLWTLDVFKDMIAGGKCVNIVTQASNIGLSPTSSSFSILYFYVRSIFF